MADVMSQEEIDKLLNQLSKVLKYSVYRNSGWCAQILQPALQMHRRSSSREAS